MTDFDDDEDELEEQRDAELAREENMPKKKAATLDVTTTVRTLVAEGATTFEELAAARELAGVDRKRLSNVLTYMKTKGELVGTGRGTFKTARGGQSVCHVNP